MLRLCQSHIQGTKILKTFVLQFLIAFVFSFWTTLSSPFGIRFAMTFFKSSKPGLLSFCKLFSPCSASLDSYCKKEKERRSLPWKVVHIEKRERGGRKKLHQNPRRWNCRWKERERELPVISTKGGEWRILAWPLRLLWDVARNQNMGNYSLAAWGPIIRKQKVNNYGTANTY